MQIWIVVQLVADAHDPEELLNDMVLGVYKSEKAAITAIEGEIEKISGVWGRHGNMWLKMDDAQHGFLFQPWSLH